MVSMDFDKESGKFETVFKVGGEFGTRGWDSAEECWRPTVTAPTQIWFDREAWENQNQNGGENGDEKEKTHTLKHTAVCSKLAADGTTQSIDCADVLLSDANFINWSVGSSLGAVGSSLGKGNECEIKDNKALKATVQVKLTLEFVPISLTKEDKLKDDKLKDDKEDTLSFPVGNNAEESPYRSDSESENTDSLRSESVAEGWVFL